MTKFAAGYIFGAIWTAWMAVLLSTLVWQFALGVTIGAILMGLIAEFF